MTIMHMTLAELANLIEDDLLFVATLAEAERTEYEGQYALVVNAGENKIVITEP